MVKSPVTRRRKVSAGAPPYAVARGLPYQGAVLSLTDKWSDAVERLAGFDGPSTISWCTVGTRAFVISVRAGLQIPGVDYQYDRLRIRAETTSAEEAAARLSSRRLADDADFEVLSEQSGWALWATTGVETLGIAPLRMPSYYYRTDIGNIQTIPNLNLDQPLAGPGLPYYPNAFDAVFEFLYGLTRGQTRQQLNAEIVIQIPYPGANIQGLQHVEDKGLLVTIGEGSAGGAVGHFLHSTWKVHHSDRSLSREMVEVSSPGVVTVNVPVAPAFVALGLTDHAGTIRDQATAFPRQDAPSDVVPLPAQALAEALDHLDAVWRIAFGEWLFNHPQMTEVAGLALTVGSRSDFESRLSYLADILGTMQIPDHLLSERDAKRLAPEASIARLGAALRHALKGKVLEPAQSGGQLLHAVQRLRVALQHQKAEDLPAAMARARLAYPGDWGKNWDLLRVLLVDALTEIRLALTTLGPSPLTSPISGALSHSDTPAKPPRRTVAARSDSSAS